MRGIFNVKHPYKLFVFEKNQKVAQIRVLRSNPVIHPSLKKLKTHFLQNNY